MKSKKLRILILITFFIALILSITGYYFKTTKEIENNYEQIQIPMHKLEQYEIKWPKISTNKLSKSIIDYEGNINMEKFKEIFETEFNSMIKDIDSDWFTFEYVIIDDELRILVDSNLRMYNESYITNPTHIYSYKLKIND